MEQIGKSVTYEWSLWYKKPLYIQHNFIIVKYSIRQRPKAVINKLTFIHIYTHPSTDFSQQEFVCLMSVLLLTLIQPTTISKRSTLQSQPSCCPIKKNPFLLTPPLIFFFFFWWIIKDLRNILVSIKRWNLNIFISILLGCCRK